MKKAALVVVIVLLSSLPLIARGAPSFTGEIMDSQCAAMGSHEMMMDKGGMKNDEKGKADCTKACVKAGGKYVLYDAANKKVYQLSDQTMPEKFAGQMVKVGGTLDGETIKVKTIMKAEK
jgi:hypothetical protein